MTPLPRRTFVRALTASLGALLLMPYRRLVAGMKQAEGTRLEEAVALDEAIAEVFALDNHAMRHIGEAAIRSGCAEHAPGVAIDILSCTGVTPKEFLDASITERRHRITLAIRNDFAGGRITEVDGWILAATEVRICLLAVPRSAG